MIWLLIVGVLVVLFGFVVVFGAPYVPSHTSEVRRAFRHLYPVSAHDVIVDFGAGDGRVLREARRRGATAVGYELNPLLVGLARLLSASDNKATIVMANFWQTDLPHSTTLVYMFGVSRDASRLARKLQREANRLERPIVLMTYGPSLGDMKHTKTYRGHHLYEFTPLQQREAQV